MAELEYRLARPNEAQAIVAFMDAHWGSNHPILHYPEYFSYYFETGEGLNFALALEAGEICAVCGYTPCNKAGTEIWISLWQAARKKNGAGLELMSRMLQLTGAKKMSCNNIREETQVFYQFLGYETGELHQYYRLALQNTYKVACPETAQPLPVNSELCYVKLDWEEIEKDFEVPVACPQKDFWYLKHRYQDFPGYEYEFYGLKEGRRILSLLVVRVNPVEDATVLRIVDFLGSEQHFSRLGGTLDFLLKKYQAEYIDCYCAGISEGALQAAGLSLRKRGSKTILPNYLNPPVNHNTDYFYFTSDAENFRMFKADGDQDRPNLG